MPLDRHSERSEESIGGDKRNRRTGFSAPSVGETGATYPDIDSSFEVRRSLVPLTLIVAGLLMAACGVSFSESQPASELFTDLTVVGEPAVLQPVTAVLEYDQVYPVPVKVKCYLIRPDRARWLVARDTIDAHPDDSSEPEGGPGR